MVTKYIYSEKIDYGDDWFDCGNKNLAVKI